MSGEMKAWRQKKKKKLITSNSDNNKHIKIIWTIKSDDNLQKKEDKGTISEMIIEFVLACKASPKVIQLVVF